MGIPAAAGVVAGAVVVKLMDLAMFTVGCALGFLVYTLVSTVSINGHTVVHLIEQACAEHGGSWCSMWWWRYVLLAVFLEPPSPRPFRVPFWDQRSPALLLCAAGCNGSDGPAADCGVGAEASHYSHNITCRCWLCVRCLLLCCVPPHCLTVCW